MDNQGLLLARIEQRLEDLDKGIQSMARTWARDDPDVWEDLAQEGRIAIYLELKQNPDCPDAHLFQRAKHIILDYRKKGKSVDGKLFRAFGRPRVWLLTSIDANPRALLVFRSRWANPVQDQALARVTYDELRERLTGQQARYLALLLRGYQGKEADRLLGLTKRQGFYLRKKIRKAAQE